MRSSLSTLFLWIGAVTATKRGLSFMDDSCEDATVLGLNDSWYYNWGYLPDGKGPHCDPPRAVEFSPMFWGCGTNCTIGLPPNYRELWKQAGVQTILGFNEPDNANQANLSPSKAASLWPQIQAVASQFSPPLQLVGPGMTHWDSTGSIWLDQFFGNCSKLQLQGCDPSLIKYIAFHDYSGDVEGIISRADAAFKKYGRKVWLTEFAVGNGKNRAANDAFMQEALPKLEKASSIFRYAWFSTRNVPGSWVAESNLLPYTESPWKKKGHTTCSNGTLKWLSGKSWQPGTLAQCAGKAEATVACTLPKTIVYEKGGNQNCYCANSTCVEESAQWQDLYVEGKPSIWDETQKKACSNTTMMWLSNGDDNSVAQCKIMAQFTGDCAHPKTIAYENGNHHNCYCANTSTCVIESSTWLNLYILNGDSNGTSLALTSTGKIYAS